MFCFIFFFFLSIIIRIHHGWLDLKSSDFGLTAASLFICLNCLFSPKLETDFTELSDHLIVTQKNQNLSEYKKLFSNDCLIYLRTKAIQTSLTLCGNENGPLNLVTGCAILNNNSCQSNTCDYWLSRKHFDVISSQSISAYMSQ